MHYNHFYDVHCDFKSTVRFCFFLHPDQLIIAFLFLCLVILKAAINLAQLKLFRHYYVMVSTDIIHCLILPPFSSPLAFSHFTPAENSGVQRGSRFHALCCIVLKQETVFVVFHSRQSIKVSVFPNAALGNLADLITFFYIFFI